MKDVRNQDSFMFYFQLLTTLFMVGNNFLKVYCQCQPAKNIFEVTIHRKIYFIKSKRTMCDIHPRTFHLGSGIAWGQVGEDCPEWRSWGWINTRTLQSSKNMSLGKNLVQNTNYEVCIKLHYFHGKAVKITSELGAPPPNPRWHLEAVGSAHRPCCYSYLLLQTSQRAFNDNTRLIAVENSKINILLLLPHCLIFTSNSAVYVDGAQKFFLPPETGYLIAISNGTGFSKKLCLQWHRSISICCKLFKQFLFQMITSSDFNFLQTF